MDHDSPEATNHGNFKQATEQWDQACKAARATASTPVLGLMDRLDARLEMQSMEYEALGAKKHTAAFGKLGDKCELFVQEQFGTKTESGGSWKA